MFEAYRRILSVNQCTRMMMIDGGCENIENMSKTLFTESVK